MLTVLLPGTKKDPYRVEKGAIQVDGFAAEFNINPASCEKEFVDNIKTVKKQLTGIVGTNFDLVCQPVVEFSKEEYDRSPLHARELGCEPEFIFKYSDAYVNDPPAIDGENFKTRTGSGHIHVGLFSPEDGVNYREPEYIRFITGAVKLMDWFVGVPVAFQNDLEIEKQRQKMYGQLSTFRPKPYGFEYRTPSNHWVSDDTLIKNVYRKTINAMRVFLDNPTASRPMLTGLDSYPYRSSNWYRVEKYKPSLEFEG